MLAAFQGLFVYLIFSLVLNYTVGADSGCEDWSLSGSQDVCCERCKPGHRLLERCGRDPKTLCTPCEPGTYTTSFNDFFCLRCTQCIGKQITVENCTISRDTVCGCKSGYRCGNDKCSFCVPECKEREEPTKNKSEQQILLVGKDPEHKNWLPVFIAGGMAGLAVLFIVVSVVAYVKAQNKTEEKKTKTDIPDQDQSDESRIMIVEQEDCSFRHPEQEQGGSSESINTQDSDSKLIV